MAVFVLACGAALAEPDRTTILADRISYHENTGELVASGSVEVYFQEFLLQARQLHYRRGVMTADGPLTLTDSRGTVAVADFVHLDENLKTAVLHGVEMLIDSHMQIAAGNLEAKDARYVLLRNALVTACRTCADKDPPIWHFRSRSAVLDRKEQEIYMRDLEFVLGGTSLFSLPWIRLPEPSVKRKSGFLIPRVSYSSVRGFTVSVPYYQTLGDHADFTVTPYINSESSHYAELETRRRFRRGWIDVRGSIALGSDPKPSIRGHVNSVGGWNLGSGFKLSFNGTKVTDHSYLDEYDFSKEDAYANAIGVTRRSAGAFFEYETSQIVQLSLAEADETMPRLVHQAFWRGRTTPPGIGGTAGLEMGALWLDRRVSAPDRPRTVSRVSASADWNRSWNSKSGLIVTYAASVSADSYRMNPEALNYDDEAIRWSGVTAVDFSMPLVRHGSARADLLEPFLQFVWSPEPGGAAVPNEDSRFVEFDATNLRSLGRFPGRDRREAGLRLNAGVKHTASVDESYDLELVLGKVFRQADNKQFTEASGLAGKASDFVASADLRLNGGIGLEQSLVADGSFQVSKATSRLTYDSEKFGFGLGYTTIAHDAGKGMTGDARSVIAGVQVGLADGWKLASDVNLDLDRKAESNVGLGLEFNRQCLGFTAKMERTLRTEDVPESKNQFSVLFSLGGLSGPAQKSPAACAGG